MPGYQPNKKVVREMEPYLIVLLANIETKPEDKKVVISFPHDNPNNLAFRFRCAIRSAREYPDTTKFQDLRDSYRFRIIGNNVVAELKKHRHEREELEVEKKLVTTDITTRLGVMQVIIENKSVDDFTFHNINYMKTDMVKLEKWCIENKLTVEKDDQTLTIKRNA